jgi:hypothetical protein
MTLDEFVVTQAKATNATEEVLGYTVRHILLRLIAKTEYENGLTVLSS